MFGSKKYFMMAAGVVAACGVAVVTGQQTAAGPYTAAQAAAGRTAYQASCGMCHGADLSGLNNASALAGNLFMSSWGGRTVNDLVGFMQGAMPPDRPGALGDETYLNIAAYILDYNGARPGNAPLAAGNATVIRTVATGQPRAQAAGRGGRGRGDQPLGGRAEARTPPTPRGLTVHGEVKNYTNVTDAMLRNPDPSDWIMLRHDY